VDIGPGGQILEPLPYHRELVTFLKGREPDLWRWMANGKLSEDSQLLRQDLLRSTYRIDSIGHPAATRAAETAALALGLTVPILLYQAEGEMGSNAGLLFVPNELIVIFSGPITDLLSEVELTAVLGHEFAHHVLWSQDNGDHFVADRLLNAMIADTQSPVFGESARRLSLTTELFADRGALIACGDLNETISALVKVATGMRSVSATSYLAQADEVLQNDDRVTGALTHPDTFLRAVSLRDWSEGSSTDHPTVQRIMYPTGDIDRLDACGQEQLAKLTQSVLEDLLAPTWMQTDELMGHARQFFPDITPVVGAAALAKVPKVDSTRKYFAYILLDFGTIDPDLDRQALIESAAMAQRLGIADEFAELLEKDLGLRQKARTLVFADAEVRSVEISSGLMGPTS
jgi:Peptidase family M48